MLKWFAKGVGMFVAAGVAINLTAILVTNRSFELTARNWSGAISVTIIGIVGNAAAAIYLWRRKPS